MRKRILGLVACASAAPAVLAGDGPLALVGVTSTRRVITIDTDTGAVSNAPAIGANPALFFNNAAGDSQGRLLSIPTNSAVPGNTGDTVYAISPADGSIIPVATLPMGLDVFGLAAGEDDALYISSRVNPGQPGSPYRFDRFDLSTGIFTPLGEFMTPRAITSLAFDADGVLWGYEGITTNARGIVVIDPETGEITDPFPLAPAISQNVLAIEFGLDGKLYACANQNAGLYEFSLETGMPSFIADIGFDVRGMALARIPAPASAPILLAVTLFPSRARRR